jgi:hypothetical protein
VSERNGSDCKYVEIYIHRVGSIGAPSRRTVFIRGKNTKQLEVPKMLGGTRRLTFSKIEAQGLNHDKPEQKKVHEDLVSVYVKFVDLISLKRQYRYMEREGKTIKKTDTNF